MVIWLVILTVTLVAVVAVGIFLGARVLAHEVELDALHVTVTNHLIDERYGDRPTGRVN